MCDLPEEELAEYLAWREATAALTRAVARPLRTDSGEMARTTPAPAAVA